MFRCKLFLLCAILCLSDPTKAALEEVKENEIFFIECPQDHGIYIRSAKWTSDQTEPIDGGTFDDQEDAFSSCNYDKKNEVEELCFGANFCRFRADRSWFGYECNYLMDLKVEYKCMPCQTESETRMRRQSGKQGYSFRLGVNPNVIVCNTAAVPNQYRPPATSSPPVYGASSVKTWPPNQSYTVCPNLKFEAKHLCTDSNSTFNAYECNENAQAVRRGAPTTQTNKNTIFLTSTVMTYRMVTVGTVTGQMTYCDFVSSASKWDCTNHPGTRLTTIGRSSYNFYCVYKGEVEASHVLGSGHYEKSRDNPPVHAQG